VRYKLTIAYRGTHYYGWQSQADAGGDEPVRPTIQQTMEVAIASVTRHPVTLIGASRTDGGVHAKGQIAHFDTDQIQIPPEGLRRAVNHAMPADILIKRIQAVPDSFDAIRSTVRKRYQYVIWNSPYRPVFFNDLVWHRWTMLDVPAMARAARYLEGEHDFASFARPGHGRKHTIRTIHACQVHYRWPKLIIGVEGSGFLWNMVRIIVGTLADVGMGRRTAESLVETLSALDRTAAGPTAPPQGLYLQWVKSKVVEPHAADTHEEELPNPEF
jgi:tRNA pseudouridine38-40 synthase